MYKIVEISSIIGSYYVEGYDKDEFCYSEIKSIINRIREEDEFISIRITKKSVNRLFELSNTSHLEEAQRFLIPSDKEVRNCFQRDFYKMDVETRKLLSKIIKEFENG